MNSLRASIWKLDAPTRSLCGQERSGGYHRTAIGLHGGIPTRGSSEVIMVDLQRCEQGAVRREKTMEELLMYELQGFT